ncbi:major facilitator superfamily domain-containing protein [Dactylonectria estremocensis]|uniref:Major facilitator superfamily domain-containing protein n=1 Tax=Dactylonectria estremocensis TaxID=1079267 RepID=A0A9P9EVM0_9HYPO|nr:major facilitator superfamily domain-containing protein [Dactylonectria estremocensis]
MSSQKTDFAGMTDDKPAVVVIDDVSKTSNLVTLDDATNKRLLRKIDWKLMPVLCFTYALQYYDKATMSQAAIFGLRADLSLEDGLKYSWATLIFSIGYIVGTYPISLLAQKYPPRIVCTIICIIWAVITLCTAACTSFGGLLANRFALGLIEAGVSPIFMLVVGLWYTHSEQVSRSSWWYSFSGGSLLISPPINYGLGHISGGSLSSWQYMYLFAGGVTLIWGVALWWLFPDSPQHAKGFTEEEHQLLLERVRQNNSGMENKNVKMYQVREALSDYQLWCILIMSTVSTTGSGAISSFGSIVFNGMGFSVYNSLLLNMPIGAMALICVLGSGVLGRTVPGSRLYIVAGSCLPVILGCALLWKLPDSNTGGRITGFYLLNFFSSAWVQCIGLGTSNVAGYTKKAVYAAGTFIGYSLGNIIGPLMFDAKYAPRYDESFMGIMICFVICIFVAFLLRWLLARENARRDQEYGVPEMSHGLEDLTDRENKSFRYNL